MTVRDSIEKTVFEYGQAAHFSPDGRRFFVMTRRGVLQSGEIEATLWLFDSAAVSAAARSGKAHDIVARKLVSLGAVSNTPPVTDARWAADGKSIAFLGLDRNLVRRLFVVTIEDGQSEALSADDRDVIAFDRAGGTIVFTTAPRTSEAARYWQSAGPGIPDIQVGTGQSLLALMHPKSSADALAGYTQTACSSEGIGCPTRSMQLWQVRNGRTSAINAVGSSAPLSLEQTSPETVSLSADGRTAILTHVYLTPQSRMTLGLPASVKYSAVAVDTATGAVSHVDEVPAGDAEDKDFAKPAMTIAVHESLNEPPVLTAALGARAKPITLWDPNPQFARIDLGEVSVYRWRDSHGRKFVGGLVKPPGYVPGRRYPLVIQTHGFDIDAFVTDGYEPTANAARPLAGRQIMVLQVCENPLEDGRCAWPPTDDVTKGSGGYIAAIQQLDRGGLIDPHKVGIIGFSVTGWHVLDALLRAPEYFAAATLAETTRMSFGEYIMNADRRGEGGHIVEANGGLPFGSSLQKWLISSPGFNTDKIAAPVLFQVNSPEALLYEWDVYALMRLQKKPVELLYIRSGDHVLVKPLQRLASQEMNVDWFDFWLNGHEDTDEAKAGQYERWRQLRASKMSSQK